MKIDITQLEFIHEKLREILRWVELETGLEFTITSIYRNGDKGVHGQLPVRGIDLRMRDETAGKAIERLINNNWSYDKKRKDLNCCLLHGEDFNMHLHVQVHDNTTPNND